MSNEELKRKQNLGKYLMARRKKSKLKYKDVCKALNISEVCLYYYENGMRSIDLETLLRFAVLYKVRARTLLRQYVGITNKDY